MYRIRHLYINAYISLNLILNKNNLFINLLYRTRKCITALYRYIYINYINISVVTPGEILYNRAHRARNKPGEVLGGAEEQTPATASKGNIDKIR